MISEDWEPQGQESGNLVLVFAWPLAHSMGLAFPCWGPQFLSCHGSRLGHTGKHQQERPGGEAGEIRCVAGLWGSAVTWGPETSRKGTKAAQPQLLSARQELAASVAILKFQEQPDIQPAM